MIKSIRRKVSNCVNQMWFDFMEFIPSQQQEEHKESQDIYMKATYPATDDRVILQSDYFESRYFVALRQFIELLCNRS